MNILGNEEKTAPKKKDDFTNERQQRMNELKEKLEQREQAKRDLLFKKQVC